MFRLYVVWIGTRLLVKLLRIWSVPSAGKNNMNLQNRSKTSARCMLTLFLQHAANHMTRITACGVGWVHTRQTISMCKISHHEPVNAREPQVIIQSPRIHTPSHYWVNFCSGQHWSSLVQLLMCGTRVQRGTYVYLAQFHAYKAEVGLCKKRRLTLDTWRGSRALKCR